MLTAFCQEGFTLPPASESERWGGSARDARRGGGHLRAACADVAQLVHPPPLTSPHHSLREWGEGNREE
jgi:hypothetical protein